MFGLSTEQQMVVETVHELARNEFAERAFTWNENIPTENLELLADRGYLGVNFAEEYGGSGLTELEAMLTIETVGTICPDTAEQLYHQQMVGPRAIEMFGSDALKERYLPLVTSGKERVAIAISEPNAGSDVGAMSTRIKERNGTLVLNGEKTWVSNIRHSDAAVVWVKFPEGLGSVVIDLDADGVEIQQHFTNMAGNSQSQFFLNDVIVPENRVLTRGKEAFRKQLRALNWERVGSATLANAIARCSVEKAIDYAVQREQFDQRIADFQGIEWKIADMVKELEASRTLAYRGAFHATQHKRAPTRLEASLAKLYSSEMVESVVSEALQIHGANGYQRGHPLEYLYRLARGRRLAAGTDEIQRNQISATVKRDGLPPLHYS